MLFLETLAGVVVCEWSIEHTHVILKPNRSLAANPPSCPSKMIRRIGLAQNGSGYNGPIGARAARTNGLLEGLSVQVIGDARIASAWWCRDKTAGSHLHHPHHHHHHHLHWVSRVSVLVLGCLGNFLACVCASVFRFLTLQTDVSLSTHNPRFACADARDVAHGV